MSRVECIGGEWIMNDEDIKWDNEDRWIIFEWSSGSKEE